MKWKFHLSTGFAGCSYEEVIDLDYLGHDEESWDELTEEEQEAELQEALDVWIWNKLDSGYNQIEEE
jgi:hypothetical protein